MNAARLGKSHRLQRVLGVLFTGDWVSTRSIIRRADVCAVNSCIAELRAHPNLYPIECRKIEGRFEYRLLGVAIKKARGA